MKNRKTFELQGNLNFPHNYVVKEFIGKKSRLAFKLESIYQGFLNIESLIKKKELENQQGYHLMNAIYDLPLTIKVLPAKKIHIEKVAQETRKYKIICQRKLIRLNTIIRKEMASRVKKKVGFQLN